MSDGKIELGFHIKPSERLFRLTAGRFHESLLHGDNWSHDVGKFSFVSQMISFRFNRIKTIVITDITRENNKKQLPESWPVKTIIRNHYRAKLLPAKTIIRSQSYLYPFLSDLVPTFYLVK